MWLMRDSTSERASGRAAGSGRKRNDASTTTVTVSGTAAEQMRNTPSVRMMRRMGRRSSHPFTLIPMRPPSVDALAREIADVGLPHPLLVDAARDAIAAGDPPSARARAEAVARVLLRPVVNGTGVLLHTNLGRAPLPPRQQPGGYANV